MALIKILSLIGISALLSGWLLNKLLRRKMDVQDSLFRNYISGLILIYLLVLLHVPLSFILKAMPIVIMVILALIVFWLYRYKRFRLGWVELLTVFIFTGIAIFISKEILNAILSEPISAWDARSIWYFKAKQLYFADGFNDNTGIYTYPYSLEMAHVEYPFLAPLLSSLLVSHFGYWNEYLPKANLILLWLGVVLAFISMKQMHIVGRLALFLFLIMVAPGYLINGYLDCWLGIYASISVVFLILFLRTFNYEYLLSCLCCLVFCNYLKQDATLLAVSILTGFTIMIITTRNFRFIKYSILKTFRALPLLLFLMIPLGIILYNKNKYKVGTTDFDFSLLSHFNEYGQIFSKAKLDLIFDYIINPIGFVNIFIVLVIVSAVAIVYSKYSGCNKKSIKNGIVASFFPILSALLFAIGMHLLYCISARDLTWHLQTSADRLRLDLLFISIPSLYGAGSLFFYFPKKAGPLTSKVKRAQKSKKNENNKKVKK